MFEFVQHVGSWVTASLSIDMDSIITASFVLVASLTGLLVLYSIPLAFKIIGWIGKMLSSLKFGA